MADIFNTPEYKRSRGAYTGQCTFEYFVSILVTDAFLAKLLSSMGVSDALIGIISSFISFAFLFQLFSLYLVQKITNTKKIATLFNTLSSLLFLCTYLIPFIPCGKTLKTVLVMMCILLGYFTNYSVTSIIYKWGNSFVSPTKRADYSATKEMISLVTGMIFTYFVGKIIDNYEALDNIRGGFLFIAVTIFIISICNFVSLLMISKEIDTAKTKKVSLKAVFKHTISNKNFTNVLILTAIWEIARYATIGFMGIYKTKELLLSVGAVQIINIAGNFLRFIFSRPIGKYSDKHSFVKGFKLALYIAAAGFFINIFSAPSSVWCVVVFTILYSTSLAGTHQNSFNMVYSYVDSEYFVQASAIKNSLGGIVGFLSSLVAGKLLSVIQSNGNSLFGIPVYGQQVLSAISFILIVIAIIFIRKVMEKQEIMIQ